MGWGIYEKVRRIGGERIMSLLELVGSILTELEVIKGKLDRLLASGGEKEGASRDVGRVELKDSDSTDSKPPVVEKTIVKGGTTVPKEIEGINLNVEYQGKQYKGKWSPCKFKCGALTSWPADYTKGDQKLHVHPTDREILGFAQEDMNGNFKCPMVVKK